MTQSPGDIVQQMIEAQTRELVGAIADLRQRVAELERQAAAAGGRRRIILNISAQ
jgi:hypothetical protein